MYNSIQYKSYRKEKKNVKNLETIQKNVSLVVLQVSFQIKYSNNQVR